MRSKAIYFIKNTGLGLMLLFGLFMLMDSPFTNVFIFAAIMVLSQAFIVVCIAFMVGSAVNKLFNFWKREEKVEEK